MIAAIGRIGANLIVWGIVLLIVVLPALTGSLGSVLAVLLALLLVPVLLDRDDRQDIARQPAIWMFLGSFAVVLACYAVTARNPGNLLYASALLALPLSPLLYAAVRRWRVMDVPLLMAVLCLIGTLICGAVAAAGHYLLGEERAVGLLMGPNVLARLALMLGFLGLSGLLLTNSRYRYLFYLGPAAAALVLIWTGTRGAALALPAMVLVLAACLAVDRRERRHLLVLIGLGVVGGVLLLTNSQRFSSIFAVIGDVLGGGTGDDSATSERIFMLEGAWGAFLHSPWVGFGWANFRPAAALAMDMTRYGTEPGGDFQFHNDFANFAVAAGIPGVLALLAMLAAPVVGALAGPRDGFYRARLYCGLQLGLGALMLGLTDFTLGYDLPTTLHAFLTVLVLAGFRERPAA